MWAFAERFPSGPKHKGLTNRLPLQFLELNKKKQKHWHISQEDSSEETLETSRNISWQGHELLNIVLKLLYLNMRIQYLRWTVCRVNVRYRKTEDLRCIKAFEARQSNCGRHWGTPVARLKTREARTHTTRSRRYNNFFCHFLGCWETANSWQHSPQWRQQRQDTREERERERGGDSVWKWRRSNRGAKIRKGQEKLKTREEEEEEEVAMRGKRVCPIIITSASSPSIHEASGFNPFQPPTDLRYLSLFSYTSSEAPSSSRGF